jgi:hypothetical protein
MSVIGPRRPTWAGPQVGSYLGKTGRDANVVAKAAHDPKPTFRLHSRLKPVVTFSSGPALKQELSRSKRHFHILDTSCQVANDAEPSNSLPVPPRGLAYTSY